MPDITTPFPWFGGKSQHAPWILQYLPAGHRYVEVFGGSGALLFAKPPSPIEVYNDVDHGLVTFFRVLRDPDLFPEFYRRVQLVPYSREEFRSMRETWNTTDDPVEQALRWYVVSRWSFSGHWGHSWSYDKSDFTARGPAHISKWLSALDELPQFHRRMMRVFIEQDDWRKILDRWDDSDTVLYLDPTYVPDTRSSGRYQHELTLDDHHDLVDRVTQLHGMVVLSGYSSPAYDPLESAGWRRVDKDVPLRAKNHNKHKPSHESERRTESLWLNPACLSRQRQLSFLEGD